MYLQDFFMDSKSYIHQHTEQTVLSTDEVVTWSKWQQSLSIVWDVRCLHDDPAGMITGPTSVQSPCNSAGCKPTQIPSIYTTAVVRLENRGSIWRLCSLFLAPFAHRWSSNWTRFKEEAHHQYKNIVQQFSCHSKHSYLSVNGPVTSAAIQIKNNTKQR